MPGDAFHFVANCSLNCLWLQTDRMVMYCNSSSPACLEKITHKKIQIIVCYFFKESLGRVRVNKTETLF